MVHIYIAKVLDLPDPKEQPALLTGLSEERKQKILRYKQEKGRKQSLGAGLLLNRVLQRCGKDETQVKYGVYGKPELEGICFNLSHSQDYAVCAVSHQPVGCDVEKIETMRERIAERFFTKNEAAYLNAFEGEEKVKEFYRIWTMKESYMKMTGEGMHLSLNQFEFALDASVKVWRDGKPCSCFIREYEIPGYKLTVCSEEAEFTEELEWVQLVPHSFSSEADGALSGIENRCNDTKF